MLPSPRGGHNYVTVSPPGRIAAAGAGPGPGTGASARPDENVAHAGMASQLFDGFTIDDLRSTIEQVENQQFAMMQGDRDGTVSL
jgi:hypothetical protein